jgi:hypothetical protein
MAHTSELSNHALQNSIRLLAGITSLLKTLGASPFLNHPSSNHFFKQTIGFERSKRSDNHY